MSHLHHRAVLRNTSIRAGIEHHPLSPAARKFACIFGLPIATAKAVAELAGYVVEVNHD